MKPFIPTNLRYNATIDQLHLTHADALTSNERTMSFILEWGRRQIREYQPWIDAIDEWRQNRRIEARRAKMKEREEKEEKARKSLEEGWEKVPRQFAHNPLEYDSAESERSSDDEAPRRAGQTTHVTNGSKTSKDQIESFPEELVDYLPQRGRRDRELLWQQHVQTSAKGQRASKQDQVRLYDSATKESSVSFDAEMQRISVAEQRERHETATEKRRKEIMEETYRDRGHFHFEERRTEERTFNP